MNILILSLLVSSIVLGGDARRLSSVSSPNVLKEGSSPGDKHKVVNGYTFGGVKDSGPSPGAGHKHEDSKTFRGIKDSGPSPGVGH